MRAFIPVDTRRHRGEGLPSCHFTPGFRFQVTGPAVGGEATIRGGKISAARTEQLHVAVGSQQASVNRTA